MKNQTTKQHRLNTGAQKVVTDWASLTGWSESRTASWFIINCGAAMSDHLSGRQAKLELDAAVKKHIVEAKAAKLMQAATSIFSSRQPSR